MALAIIDPTMTFPPGSRLVARQTASLEHVQVSYRHGSVIKLSDSAAPTTFAVASGVAALCLAPKGDRLTCIGFIGAGGIIGPELTAMVPTGCTAICRSVGQLDISCMPSGQFQRALDGSMELRAAYLAQTQRRMLQAQHVAVCNVRHPLGARCAHWMLALQRRLGDVLPLTHEFFATVLGVRRAGVGVTLQALQRSGIIRQDRGSITILNIEQLQNTACCCPIIEETPVDLARWTEPVDAVRRSDVSFDVRRRVEAATQMQASGLVGPDRELIRRQAMLDVCRTVIAQTTMLLSDRHP